MSDSKITRVAVLGGGITGLAAAHTLARLRREGAPIDEFLLERGGRLGGTILTERVEGFVVEGGPDSFLAEKPEAAALCRELGLGESLLASNDAERRTYILDRGRLVPLPDGLMLLIPTRLWPVLLTPLLPLSSKLAIARDFVRPRRRARAETGDEPVAAFVRRHFGQAMLDQIAAPLLAGVFGGDSEQLSVRSVLPRFVEMEEKHGSLTRAALRLRRERRAARPPGGDSRPPAPLFLTPKGGMGSLIDALAASADPARLHLGQRVASIVPSASGPRYTLGTETGRTYAADALVLALPAYECARLLGPLDAKLGEALAAIPYSSSLTISLGYAPGAARGLPPGFGFLAPRQAGGRLLAVTFVHRKFAHRAPPECALLRGFLGGVRDAGVLDLDDAALTRLVLGELRSVLKLDAEPRFVRVSRWPASMPQYVVGHGARLRAIESRLEALRGIRLAGNAYSGVGISDCIRTARAAAEKARAQAV